MADALVRKIAKDQVSTQVNKRVSMPNSSRSPGILKDLQNGYIFSAPGANERGKKLSKSEKVRWEMERYTDPRWAIPEHDLKLLMEVKRRAKTLDA